MIARPEVKKVAEADDSRNDISKLDLTKASDEDLRKIADGITWNQENWEQVKVFPDLWNSLSPEMKNKIAWQLTDEIRNSIKELSDQGIEYSPEITQEDADNVAALEFVRSNKEKIPQSWVKLEEKANEVAKDMAKEIVEKGIYKEQPKN